MRSYYLVCSIVLSSLILPLALKADSKKEMFELACNDLLHISLDTNCTATITANMVLEDMIGLATDYTIKVYLNNVLQSDLLFGSQDINKIFDYKIWHNVTGNSCWGQIKIEDKFAPKMICSNDTVRCSSSLTPATLGFPIPSWLSTTISVQSVTPPIYLVYGWDKCSRVTLSYTDNVLNYGCDSVCLRKIIRTWVATDSLGNASTCNDTICVLKPTAADINYPKHYDGMSGLNSLPYLLCTSTFPKLPNGNPDPIYTGHPISSGCTTLNATYSDLKIPVCDGTYKLLRRWIILDWCTQGLIEYDQIIKVVDDIPPVIQCPIQFTVGMSPYSCTATTKIPPPTLVNDCGKWTYDVYVKLREPVTGQPAEPSKLYITYNSFDKCFYLTNAPEGRIWIIYYVTDDCGNKSECATEIGVVDNLAPIAVCDQKTVITLTNDGTAKAFAESFDDGSLDNCKIAEMKVARMTNTCGTGTAFGDYVTFCCADVGTTVMVAFEVTDTYGNKNTCMVEATVQEKVPPVIIPPSDVTISCNYKFNNLEEFGTVRLSESSRQDIIIRDVYYTGPNFIAGRDGLATDNCSVTFTEIVDRDLVCNQGIITRTFIAKDQQGLTSIATQRIYVQNNNPFNRTNITFPFRRDINSCNNVITDPSNTGVPTYTNIGCAQLAANYEDLKLTIVDSVCFKILRKWTVVDWCQYNAAAGTGIWTETQIINVKNSEPPMITSCQFVDFCDKLSYHDNASGLCYGNYELLGAGTDDCTSDQDLLWSYKIDTNNDGIFDLNGNGQRAAGQLPVGTYRLKWTLQDQCGNFSNCDQIFTIRDCKKPTPYCLNGIATVVMPTTKTIIINAKDFDVNSSDNCTQPADLKISFSPDPNHNSLVLTCDSLKGQTSRLILIRIYVTDEAGNQDYCETYVKLQDNNNTCNGTLVNYGGNLKRANQSNIPKANLQIYDNSDQLIQSVDSDLQGDYAFGELVKGEYKIVPFKEDEFINGVTTYDIVQIQKHILGTKPITDPFKLIAADVNNSKSITARDISEIRKLILGVSSGFQNNKVWRFIPKGFLFVDMSSPYDFPEFITTKDIEEINQNHFIGIKVGDIDQSAELIGAAQTRSNTTLSLVIDQGIRVSPSVVKYGVFLDRMESLEGLQIDLRLKGDRATILSLESGLIELDPESYILLSNELKLSYGKSVSQSIGQKKALFYILVENAEVNENNKFELIQNAIKPEAYFADGLNAIIQLNSYAKVNGSIKLLPNQPNPFSQSTKIRFETSDPTEVNIKIYTSTGSLMYSDQIKATKGQNELSINRSQIVNSGIYFYEISTQNEKLVQKMIVID